MARSRRTIFCESPVMTEIGFTAKVEKGKPAIIGTADPERRNGSMRRQWNEAFCGPDGTFSIVKFIAVWAQISVLAHFNRWFDQLIDKPESLLILLCFLIAPDLIKKALVLKLGGGK